MYLKLVIRVACRQFLAFNSLLKPDFGTQYTFVFVLAGRGYDLFRKIKNIHI